MVEELDHGNPQEGESLEDLGNIELNGKMLFVSRWKWHGSRGEQIIFSEKSGRVPVGRWRWASVKYRTLKDGEVVFSGISVPSDLQGIGSDLFKYFIDDCHSRGKSIVGSDVIRKPLIAQMLSRAGWKPESTKHLAEILPLSKYADSGIPKVHALSNDVPNSPKWKDFYTLVEAKEVERRYPMTDPSNSNVAIFTRYFPNKEEV